MANVLVTGGAGFVGSHVAEACLEAGDSVRVVDNLASGAAENIPSGAVFHEGDVADAEFMRRVAEEARPDVIHHLAAQSSVTYSLAEPELDARAFKRETGWRHSFTLEEGIAAFAESLET